MPTPIPVEKPFVLKTAEVLFFTLDAGGTESDFSDHIGEITLTPTAQTGSWTAVNGKVIQDVAPATWAVQFGLVQDLSDNGFLRWLLQHEGEKADVEITFATGADLLSITVTLSPSTIGGAVGPNPLSGTVTMPVDGKPVWS